MTAATAPRPRFAAPALLAAVGIAYAGALQGPFQFDDWWAIVGNPSVHSLSAWREALPGIRPLLKLVNTLNWLASPAPAAFHALNLLVHAANGLLLWRLLARWLPRLAPACTRPAFAAFTAALLFALHPAATEAVTYIGGRSIVLSSLFSLAALLAWSRGLDDDAAPRAMAWLGAALFAMAMAVRETALVTPLAWLLLARCGGHSWREARAPLRPAAGVAAALLVVFALTPGYHSFVGWSLQTRGLPAQLLGQREAHLYLLTGPLPGRVLNIDPDLHVPAAFAMRHALLLAGAGLALAIAWHRRARQPWLLFALGWYALQLAPANSLLPRFDLVNDRHLYLALPSPLLALGIGLAALRPRMAAGLLLAAAALAAGTATWQRNRDYRSELALWEATVAQSPRKARPWTNLGHARQQAGDDPGARHAYACAIALDPGYAQARWNLAALGPGPASASPSPAMECTIDTGATPSERETLR